jgi:hypothetical protein
VNLLLEIAVMPDNNQHRLYEVATVLAQSPNPNAKKGGSVAQFVGDFDWILDLVKFFG